MNFHGHGVVYFFPKSNPPIDRGGQRTTNYKKQEQAQSTPMPSAKANTNNA